MNISGFHLSQLPPQIIRRYRYLKGQVSKANVFDNSGRPFLTLKAKKNNEFTATKKCKSKFFLYIYFLG
jgi:hypothetical protein